MTDLYFAEAAREYAVHRSGAARRGRDPELECIVAFTAAKYRMRFAALSIITGRRQILIASVGTDIRETPRDQAFCAVTIQQPGEPLIVPDARLDTRFAHFASVVSEPCIRFYAGVSIVDMAGYPLGALCIADPEPHAEPFDSTDLLIRAHEVERHIRR